MLRYFSLMFFLLSFLNAEDVALKKIFSKSDIMGTIVIASLKDEKTYVYNRQRADQRFSPASTFKIPHTLIVFSEKIVEHEDDIIKWDGVKRGYEAWNRDQTLHTAITASCVWCYKKFSQRISKKKYIDYMKKFDYGNKTLGLDKSSFWLNGALKISAYEQTAFLKRLYNNDLPIKEHYIHILKNMLTIDKNNNYELKAKSGWDGHTGWYVGYVKTAKDVYFFAMNADLEKEQLHLRQKIVLDALKAKNLI